MNTLLPNKLGHQDALLKVMFEHATIGIVMTNEEGVIIRCNPYATKMFGYEIDELDGQKIEILIPNKFHTNHLGNGKFYSKNTVPSYMGVGGELLAMYKSGKHFPVEASLSYAQDGEQKIVIAMINDITNRIEKEKELIVKSEAISFATTPICFADLEGRITYANPAFVKLWGFEKEEDIIGKSNMDLGTSPEKVKKIMAVMSEMGSWTGYDKVKRIDGTSFDVFLTTSLVRSGGGIPICTVATFMDITVLKQTQKVLEEKSQTLRSSMRLAKLGSWQFDLSTNKVFLDDQTKAIFGLPSDKEFLDFDEFIALYLPTDQQDIIAKLQHAIETKSSCKTKCSILVKHNEPRWISSEVQALLNEQGEVIKMIGVSLDITNRIKTEASNRDISKIVEESLNEIFIFDAKSLKFVQVNSGARQNLGYSLEELQQLTPVDIKPDFTKDAFLKLVQPLLSRETEKLEIHTIHLRKNGTTYPVEIHLQYSTLGSRSVFIAIILDITERIKAEQQLHEYSNQLEQKVAVRTNELAESQEKLLEAQKVSKVGYIEYNLVNNTIQGSKQFYKILELESQAPLTFENLLSYVHSDDLTYLRSIAADAKGMKKSLIAEHRIISAKGNVKHIYSKTSSIIKDSEGNPIERRGIIQDITALKVMENTLRENQIKLEKALKKEQELSELKSRFVSMASHEFRTPLTTISSSTDLVRMHLERGNLDKYQKHLNTIKSAVKNLTSILNDFLSLEKLESGKVYFNPEPIDLGEFVLNILEEVNLLTTHTQTINYLHTGEKAANIDPHLVRNILINLLSNAIKYSPNGEDIDLILDITESSFVIKIKDRGIGIPQDQQEKMFSRFFRATNVSTIQGTGIGLTIVKRYLDIMKGSISFKSKLNKGSTFIVEIPQ